MPVFVRIPGCLQTPPAPETQFFSSKNPSATGYGGMPVQYEPPVRKNTGRGYALPFSASGGRSFACRRLFLSVLALLIVGCRMAAAAASRTTARAASALKFLPDVASGKNGSQCDHPTNDPVDHLSQPPWTLFQPSTDFQPPDGCGPAHGILLRPPCGKAARGSLRGLPAQRPSRCQSRFR